MEISQIHRIELGEKARIELAAMAFLPGAHRRVHER